ncbi:MULTISPECIES: hypothetical protein [Pseudomonas]|nr:MULTISPECIES: hypothetical protein [Pseudomonas]
MKTIAGFILGMFAGAFVAAGIIVVTQLVGFGAHLIGFGEYTYMYYTTCLCLCIALLAGSKPARQHLRFMLVFFVAVLMVMGVGFQSFIGESTGAGQAAQMQANLLAMAILVAKIFMYLTPGALTAFYALIAFENLPDRLRDKAAREGWEEAGRKH